jgi:hypothetical protein
MNSLSTVIEKYLGRWWVCILFGLIATYMFAVLVPDGVDAVTQQRSLAPRILDEYYLTWTAQQAQTLFSSLGETGRKAYRLFYLRLDFWFPVLSLSIFYASLLSIAFPRASRFQQVNLLPTLMYFLDAAENVNHFTMAGSYPDLPEIQLSIGPVLTLLKYLLITTLPLLAFFGFALKRTSALRKIRIDNGSR